jgi:hypothetical protein
MQTPHSDGAPIALPLVRTAFQRIVAVLGHADLRMTLRTYAHIRPEDLAAPLDVLAGVERRSREGTEEKKAVQ